MKCENCEKEHDGSYGSGRFCSVFCKQQYNGKSKINKKYCCKFCGKEFDKPTSLGAHTTQCKLNPNSTKTKLKSIDTKSKNTKKQNPLISITLKCYNCGKEFIQIISKKQYKRNKIRKCCSSHCAHAYVTKFINYNQVSSTLKNKIKTGQCKGFCKTSKPNCKTSKPKFCNICGKQIDKAIFSSKLYCSEKCLKIGKHNKLSKLAKSRCNRGEFGGKNNDTYKKHKRGWYKGFFCGSSWELVFLIWALDHNLNIKRCDKVFKYEYNEKFYNYYPDFEIDGIIYEIKGFEDYKAKAKREQFPEIIVLKRNDLKKHFAYVIKTYGKNYIELLTKYKCEN